MITLDDLYQSNDYSFDFPDVPNYAYSYNDIPKAKRKNQNQALLTSIAQAIGGGFDSGHLGSALAAAAAQIQPRKDREVEDYRAQQDRGFQAQERQAEKSAQLFSVKQREQTEKQEAQRVLAVYQQTQGAIHPADQASAARLDAAARALDIDEIQKIAQSAAERGSMYGQGVNPDDPTAIAKYKHDQQIAQYEEQQKLQMDSNIAQAQKMRELGLTAPPNPPQPYNDPVQTALAIQRGMREEGLGGYRPELLQRYANEANRPPSIDPLAKMAAEASKDPLTGQINEDLYKKNMDTLTRMLRGGQGASAAVPPKVGGQVNASHAAPTGPGGKPPVNPLKPPVRDYPKELLANPKVAAKIKELEAKRVPKDQILKLLRQAGFIK